VKPHYKLIRAKNLKPGMEIYWVGAHLLVRRRMDNIIPGMVSVWCGAAVTPLCMYRDSYQFMLVEVSP
jgi:hypothetical protein